MGILNQFEYLEEAAAVSKNELINENKNDLDKNSNIQDNDLLKKDQKNNKNLFNSNSAFDSNKNFQESLYQESDYFTKSKIFRMHGKVQSAFENLENAFLQKNIYSYYYLYFYITGTIGKNEIIPNDKILEPSLLILMNESLNLIEKQAYEDKNVDAIDILGQLFFNGIIYEKNNQKAKEIFSTGAELNCPFCLNLLAIIYDCERNSVCVIFYLKAIEQNSFYAKVNYAFKVKDGVYVKENENLFVEILESLANEENDFYPAQFHLANFYLEEKNDFGKAIVYYAKASKNMHEPSKKKVLEILKDNCKVNFRPLDIPEFAEVNEAVYYIENKSLGKKKKLYNSECKMTIKELKENVNKLNSEIKILKCEKDNQNKSIKKKTECTCMIF